MNPIAAPLIALASVTGTAVVDTPMVREYVLTTQCTHDGGTPLWLAASSTDRRPAGLLSFKCDHPATPTPAHPADL